MLPNTDKKEQEEYCYEDHPQIVVLVARVNRGKSLLEWLQTKIACNTKHCAFVMYEHIGHDIAIEVVEGRNQRAILNDGTIVPFNAEARAVCKDQEKVIQEAKDLMKEQTKISKSLWETVAKTFGRKFEGRWIVDLETKMIVEDKLEFKPEDMFDGSTASKEAHALTQNLLKKMGLPIPKEFKGLAE